MDSTFLSSEILPSSYKMIRKDLVLGGGGSVFIGFKNSLRVVKSVEMLWPKLQV